MHNNENKCKNQKEKFQKETNYSHSVQDQFPDVGTQCTSRWWNSLLHEILVKFSGKETNRTSQGKINNKKKKKKWTQILDEVGANTRASNSGETLSDYCIVSQYHCIVS